MSEIKKEVEKYLVLDIGGTFIKYGVINKNYQFYEKGKIRNEIDTNFLKFKKDLYELYLNIKNKYQIKAIAISSFGVINKKNNGIYWCGKERKLYQQLDFKKLFNNTDFYIENDANCAAIGEMKFVDDVPAGVSVNEAVELTKKYGTEDDASYVNGVLGAVAKAL